MDIAPCAYTYIHTYIYYTYCLSVQLSILSILFILSILSILFVFVIYLSDVGMCISYNKRSIIFTIGWINMFIAHIYIYSSYIYIHIYICVYIYMYIHFCMHMYILYKYVCIDIHISSSSSRPTIINQCKPLMTIVDH